MKRTRIALLASIAACAISVVVGAPEKLTQNKDGNFVLYVTNQSFDLSPVDITIHIDGKKAVSGEFHVKDQHHWVRHTFELAEGKHKIQVSSIKGEALLEQELEIREKTWGLLFFAKKDGEKGFFQLMIHYKPMGISKSPSSRGDQFRYGSAFTT
jgi:hypothetical protein